MAEDVRTDRRPGQAGDGESPVDRVHDRFARFKAWRKHIKSRRSTRLMYRSVIGVVGGGIAVGGLFLVPLPGPGWLVVLLGLAVLATEFTWAARLQQFIRGRLKAWTAWLTRQSWPVRGLVGLGTAVLVLAVLYGLFAITGVPGWLPDALTSLPGLSS